MVETKCLHSERKGLVQNEVSSTLAYGLTMSDERDDFCTHSKYKMSVFVLHYKMLF